MHPISSSSLIIRRFVAPPSLPKANANCGAEGQPVRIFLPPPRPNCHFFCCQIFRPIQLGCMEYPPKAMAHHPPTPFAIEFPPICGSILWENRQWQKNPLKKYIKIPSIFFPKTLHFLIFSANSPFSPQFGPS